MWKGRQVKRNSLDRICVHFNKFILWFFAKCNGSNVPTTPNCGGGESKAKTTNEWELCLRLELHRVGCQGRRQFVYSVCSTCGLGAIKLFTVQFAIIFAVETTNDKYADNNSKNRRRAKNQT